MKPAGLILSAGESRRMGRPKALLPFRGETFLDGLIGRFAAVCDPVIVVLGHNASVIRAGLQPAHQAQFEINPDYQQGQLSSMQCGLRAVPSSVAGVLFTLVDHPNVSAGTLEKLAAQSGSLIVAPVHEGRKGHPIFFSASLIGEFLALPPDAQARDVLRRHAAHIRLIPVDDPGILDNVDDPAAYAALVGA